MSKNDMAPCERCKDKGLHGIMGLCPRCGKVAGPPPYTAEQMMTNESEQHQGEPVAWIRQYGLDELRGHHPAVVSVFPHKSPAAPIPLYTHADPGEVVRFGIQVEKLLCEALGREWSATGISIETLVAELKATADPSEVERLRAENEALACNLRGKHALTGATYTHLVQERDTLLAQLAERDALMVKANYVIDHARTIDKQAFGRGTQNVDPGLFRGLGNLLAQYDEALSASAEPSAPVVPLYPKCSVLKDANVRYSNSTAPVERDERADFEEWAKAQGLSVTRTPNPLCFANCTRRAAGDYIDLASLCSFAAWQARAALERK